jgi:Arc/MetJ-type ribon-helix-helix transcriptional regulator
MDGERMAEMMADKVQDLRPKAADSEKITINLGFVDLGHIDLLVQEGFYSNRTDFIRTAIRNQLDRQTEPLTDPDLILSHHPARATARRLPPSVELRVPPVAG